MGICKFFVPCFNVFQHIEKINTLHPLLQPRSHGCIDSSDIPIAHMDRTDRTEGSDRLIDVNQAFANCEKKQSHLHQ